MKRTLLVTFAVAACSRAPVRADVEEAPLIVVAAGDISAEVVGDQEVTAKLVESLSPQLVLVPGDVQYGKGELHFFQTVYEETWGRFKAITRPAPGNHEYKTAGAAGYFDYFGELAGPERRGWYSFDLGAWHFISLNTGTFCADGACGPGSPQYQWLEDDLTRTTKKCVIAYWHHPRFNSGHHGPFEPAQHFWKLLLEHRAELVLAGHEHFYERFEPLDENGEPSPNGLVQLTVGTGGIGFSELPEGPSAKGSAARQNDTFGVMKLTLTSTDWQAEFVPVPGRTFTDRTGGKCE